MKRFPIYTVCPACNGAQQVPNPLLRDWEEGDPPVTPETIDCPTCEGVGEIKIAELEKD